MAIKRFQEKLKQQLTFMVTSCENYDRGQDFEAIRISTILRTLFKNSKSMKSLLKHLGEEHVPILSTCPIRESIPDGLAFDGLTCISKAGIQPKLGPSSTDIELPAADWWEQNVLSLGDGPIMSRKDIVCDTADKDGGAHVDANLPQNYKKIVDGLWVSATGGGRYSNHHFRCLRQMAYEVLASPKLLAIAGYKGQPTTLKKAKLARQEMFLLISRLDLSRQKRHERRLKTSPGSHPFLCHTIKLTIHHHVPSAEKQRRTIVPQFPHLSWRESFPRQMRRRGSTAKANRGTCCSFNVCQEKLFTKFCSNLVAIL